MTGEVSFVEIGVPHVGRGRMFYEELFGWTFEPAPSGSGLVITSPNVRGGMHQGDPGEAPYVFFRVDDMDVALAKVRELGGEIDDVDTDGDADSIAKFGRFKTCRDNQGSVFGIHQPPGP